MSRRSPGEETFETVLEDEDNANPAIHNQILIDFGCRAFLPRIKATEIVRHQRKGETGPVDILGRPDVGG